MSGIPRISWERFLQVFDWKQGQHVSLIGTTGAGKTHLGLMLMNRRKYTVVLGTKPKDSTLSKMHGKGKEWVRISDWSGTEPIITAGRCNRELESRRYLLWPRYESLSDVVTHRQVFQEAIANVWVEGGWTIFGDEVFYLKKFLGLEAAFEQIWAQGRSLNVSLVAATQRPAHVPLMMFSQAQHLFLWKVTDRRDRKRLVEISGSDVDLALLDYEVARLDSRNYEVIWVSTSDGRMAVIKPPA